MTTPSDILTTQKNGVIGINNLSQELKSFFTSYRFFSGQYRSQTVSSRTQVASGSGRLVSINVVTAGSTAGGVYDTVLLNVTGASGDGTKATVTYSPTFSTSVGETIFVTGISPSGYNETAGDTITDVVSTSSLKYANITTTTYVSGGVIFVSRASEQVCAVANTIGNYIIGAPFSTGLVINPGTSQVLNVVYSLD